LKARDRIHHGPQEQLVRELFRDPQATSSHDYLGCPETIQDVARAFHAAYGVDLESRFCSSTRPAIVKFAAVPDWDRSCRRRSGMPSQGSAATASRGWRQAGFDGQGTAVAPQAIVTVEVLVLSPPRLVDVPAGAHHRASVRSTARPIHLRLQWASGSPSAHFECSITPLLLTHLGVHSARALPRDRGQQQGSAVRQRWRSSAILAFRTVLASDQNAPRDA
jgi:hypothetical protein